LEVVRRLSLLTCLVVALLLGSCSRALDVTTPVPGGTLGAGARDVPMNCPNMIPNTPETAIQFETLSGLVSKNDGRRIRFEMNGDLPSPSIDLMGPCVDSPTPSIVFTSAHANVFIHGTNISVTSLGQPLAFGPLQVPQTGEQGVVIASDPFASIIEVVWPSLAAIGVGSPIIRVQLTNWNTALVTPAKTYDVVWDMTAVRDSVTMYFTGRADSLNLLGTPTAQAAMPPSPPCPQALAGTSDTVITQFAGVVQFRPARMRFELDGDIAKGVIEASGTCAATATPAVYFTGGSANVYLAGTTQSVIPGGQPLTFGALVVPPTGEQGVVLAQDSFFNTLEIIWPKLAGVGSGPPILRLELTRWVSTVGTGAHVDVAMRFDAIGPDGVPASYWAHAKDIEIPVMK